MDVAETSAPAGLLLHLAAEGIAPIIQGCTTTLATRSTSVGNGALDGVPRKAINLFGPPIIKRWLAELRSKGREEQLNAILQLARLSAADSRREATAAVERFARGSGADDKLTAVEYLAAIPLAVRRSLVPDPASGRMRLPANLSTEHEPTLIGLLPVEVPPFPIGSDLPGTSYRLEELLGIGGFGAVYKASNRFEQNQPPRAIKFCLDPSMVATLHRERAILDRLMAVSGSAWSDRIVRLYGYALDVQPPFLVYEYVPGGDLTSHLAATQQRTGRGFPPALALDLVRQVAEALAVAHAQSLVHRDLKPANVLLSGTTIKLTDFGIGSAAAGGVRGSSIGSAAIGQLTAADQARLFRGSGTPLYMSAEQRRGDQPDPRHDLYSLGVMWYQLLVGDVTRELHPGWPDELIEEFQTPKEHIELIQRCVGYFKKRPAHAGELLPLLQAARTAQASAPASVVEPAPPAAPRAPQTGGRSTAPAEGHSAKAPPPSADFEKLKLLLADQIDRDALTQARQTIAAMLRLKPEDQEALEVLAFLNKRLVVSMAQAHSFTDHQGWVRCVALAPDGRHALSGGDDMSVRLWELGSRGQLRCFTGHQGAVMSVAFAPDTRLAVSASWDGTLRLWEVASGREGRRFEGNWKAVKCVAFSPDGRHIVFGTDDHAVRLWEVEPGRELHAFSGHTDLVQALLFSPDGRLVISGGDDGTVRLWNVDGKRECRCLHGHLDSVTSLACTPDGRWLLSASSDRTVRLWDLTSGRELRRLKGHTTWVNAVAFSSDGCWALSGSGGEIKNGQFLDGDDKSIRLWDVLTGNELARFDGHRGSVTSVALAPDARVAVSASLDKTVRLLSLTVSERPA